MQTWIYNQKKYVSAHRKPLRSTALSYRNFMAPASFHRKSNEQLLILRGQNFLSNGWMVFNSISSFRIIRKIHQKNIGERREQNGASVCVRTSNGPTSTLNLQSRSKFANPAWNKRKIQMKHRMIIEDHLLLHLDADDSLLGLLACGGVSSQYPHDNQCHLPHLHRTAQHLLLLSKKNCFFEQTPWSCWSLVGNRTSPDPWVTQTADFRGNLERKTVKYSYLKYFRNVRNVVFRSRCHLCNKVILKTTSSFIKKIPWYKILVPGNGSKELSDKGNRPKNS